MARVDVSKCLPSTGASHVGGLWPVNLVRCFGFDGSCAQIYCSRSSQRSGRSFTEIREFRLDDSFPDLLVFWHVDRALCAAVDTCAGLPFFQRENPFHHHVDLILGMLRVRKHRDLAPDTGGAFEHTVR